MVGLIFSESSEESGSEHRQLIHRALRGILIQVPTGRSVLYPILCDYFPHKRFSRNVLDSASIAAQIIADPTFMNAVAMTAQTQPGRTSTSKRYPNPRNSRPTANPNANKQ